MLPEWEFAFDTRPVCLTLNRAHGAILGEMG